MSFTTLSPHKERLGVKEPLPETLQTLMDEHIRATEKTWTMLSPFQREELMLEAILELSLHPLTGVLVATPMEASKAKLANEKGSDEFSKK